MEAAKQMIRLSDYFGNAVKINSVYRYSQPNQVERVSPDTVVQVPDH